MPLSITGIFANNPTSKSTAHKATPPKAALAELRVITESKNDVESIVKVRVQKEMITKRDSIPMLNPLKRTTIARVPIVIGRHIKPNISIPLSTNISPRRIGDDKKNGQVDKKSTYHIEICRCYL